MHRASFKVNIMFTAVVLAMTASRRRVGLLMAAGVPQGAETILGSASHLT